MASYEIDLDSPAIRALGSLFKLTEVFLWDDGCSSDSRQVSSFPKHIRFKYDDDDSDDDDSAPKISSSISLNTMEDSIITEDAELTQQMSELGLPISFQTSKQKDGQTKSKSKVKKLKNQHNQKRSEDQVQGSSKVSEESLCNDDSQDKSSNSSSLSLPHQTELSCSGTDATDDIIDENLMSKTCYEDMDLDLQPEAEMTAATSNSSTGTSCSRSYIHDSGFEQNEREINRSLTEQVNTESSELGNKDDNENIRCSDTAGDWSACWDSFYMRYYFYNAKTQESTWDPPPGMENFAFGDYSCVSSESNAESAEVNIDPAVSRHEEQVDRCELAEQTGSDDQTGSRSWGRELTTDDLSSSSVMLTDSTCIVNENDLHALDGNSRDEIPLGSAVDPIEHCHGLEIIADDFDMQDIPVSTKRKKTRKNRRKKSLNENDDHEFQLVKDSYVDITKYWCQRYLLFSRFDHGIKMDEEGWFSVTPEAIAKHQASRCGGGIVIDCFAGVGGNAIQFAKVDKQVIAIDIDPRKIDYAHHNATIYGVEDEIDFITGDSFQIAPKLTADTVFLSPPWGGPDYAKVESYDISMLRPYDGQCLFNTFKAIASMIIMFLPRNVNVNQLAELSLSANPPWSLEVEKNFLNDKLKAVTAYFSKTSE